jgi:head-tail adaptor
VQAGELRQRVTLKQDTETDDSHLGVTTSATTIRSRIAAEVVALAGRDLERARAIDPRAGYTVALRYWQDYRTDLDGGRFYVVWHDGTTDRRLEAVEPPRETVHRVRLEFVCRERA